MPETLYYFLTFVALMVVLWTMMLVLDRIWPSNFEREQDEREKRRREGKSHSDWSKPHLP